MTSFDGEIRGELWTARAAEANMGLARGVVDQWVLRGHIKPALEERPRLFWSDDLYDCKVAGRRQRATRDEHGRFLPRVALG